MPRSLSPAAMSRRLVTPLACALSLARANRPLRGLASLLSEADATVAPSLTPRRLAAAGFGVFDRSVRRR
jgi:hypothetical protein